MRKSTLIKIIAIICSTNIAVAQNNLSAIKSSQDGEHFFAIDKNTEIIKYRYDNGEAVDTVFSTKWTQNNISRITKYTLSQDENLLIIPTEIEQIYRHSYKAKNWVYDRNTKKIAELSTKGKQQIPSFAPNGQKIAFVRNNDIFIVDLVAKQEQQITFDGQKNKIINGLCDWVYEEEYGFDKAYQWSTASDAIAYYRFNEQEVKEYYMPVFQNKLYPENLSFKYPKAGEDNAEVSIRVYDIVSGKHKELDKVSPGRYDGYFPLIQWTGRNNELAVHKLNRQQNNYRLYLFDTSLGAKTMVYTEKSDKYIDRIDESKIQFLPMENRFIVLSEQDGYRHLYIYDMTGKFIRQLTKGEWEVTEINGIDQRERKIYLTAAKNSPLSRQLYSVGYAGRRPQSLQKLNSVKNNRGTYSAIFSKGARYYVQSYSDTDTPLIQTLHSATNGETLRTIQNHQAQKQSAEKGGKVTRHMLKLMAEDGKTELNGYILLPADFDSTKTYPLLMAQYSGPGSQSVADRWTTGGWEYGLVRDGIIVACFDGRGTGYRGRDFRQCTYKDLGNIEVMDQIAVAQQLAKLEYIDGDRIGIYGWSYGGFMALNCILKGADVFAAAVAVAPVTTWRYYDTIYTELYNGDPNENPQGYDQNSPINFAQNLKGKLLIVHGTADDNVHIQNTYDMISALNKEGKEFEMLIYPDCNHSMSQYRNDVLQKSHKFLKENL